MAAPSLPGADGVQAQWNYAALRAKYMDFALPQATVLLGDKPFSSRQGDMIVGDLNVELTSGFEASIARFRIYNVYDADSGQFRFGEVERQVALGATLTIQLGYVGRMETVFVGFVAGISFDYEPGQLPYVEVTGMDVKGIMMAGSYACQLTASSYGDAVREILQRTGYANLKAGGGILDLEISDTPDMDPALRAASMAAEQAKASALAAQRSAQAAQASAGEGTLPEGAEALLQAAQEAADAVRSATEALNAAKEVSAQTKAAARSAPLPAAAGPVSAYTVELVSESDYEFVVKAAKRFHFEFFVDRGTIYFRKAKCDTYPLMELGSGSGILGFHIEYSITGIVGAVEARAMDPGAGKIISAQSKFTNNLSTDSQAKRLVSQGKKVLVDPTISSQDQADARVASLLDRMSYRLGTLEADCVGIPDLVPGRFIRLSGLGAPVDNTFYVTSVVHDYREDTGFHTRITACTDRVEKGGVL